MAKILAPNGEPVYMDHETMVHEAGDKTIITNFEDIEPIFEQTYEAKKLNNNGFSKGRSMRYLGSIPLSTLVKHPELYDDNELKKFLRKRPRYRAVDQHSF